MREGVQGQTQLPIVGQPGLHEAPSQKERREWEVHADPTSFMKGTFTSSFSYLWSPEITFGGYLGITVLTNNFPDCFYSQSYPQLMILAPYILVSAWHIWFCCYVVSKFKHFVNYTL